MSLFFLNISKFKTVKGNIPQTKQSIIFSKCQTVTVHNAKSLLVSSSQSHMNLNRSLSLFSGLYTSMATGINIAEQVAPKSTDIVQVCKVSSVVVLAKPHLVA